MKKLLLVAVVSFMPFVSLAKGNAVVDVALTPAGDFKAKSEEVTGSAKMKGDVVTAENISVSLKNLKTGIAMRDKHARDKYLEVEKYPTIVLVKAEGKGGKGKGKVKYRGVEKDVEGTYTVKGDRLIASFPLNLSDFNIKGIKYMGVGVDNEVKVNVDVPIAK